MLDRSEQRVMFITVVGGLASIILGAVILGGALALAHAIKTHPDGAEYAQTLFALITLGAGVILLSYIYFRRFRGRPIKGSLDLWRHSPLVIRAAAVTVWLVLCVYLLALLGIAAGVK
jgi:hypothetical protein